MAEVTQLKTFFSTELVRRIAADIARVHPSFPTRVFVKDASSKLPELELMARGAHIASAMKRALPPAYPDALGVLLRSLGPESKRDELLGGGMAPFFYLPHSLFVAEHGLDHFDLSMRAQHTLTKRFTAQFSIRPYIAQAPERAFEYFRDWPLDESPHVRRLVSEGTRLRLPWARRVSWLDENPERVLTLLELLKDDPTPLVRRSVANNLNDLGKLSPDLLVRTCRSWLKQADEPRRRLVEHALRSAVKRGDPGALTLLGFGARPSVSVENARFSPRSISVGQSVTISFELRNATRKPQNLLVDLGVHFVKANGKSRPKVFKLKRVTLAGGEAARFEHRVSFAEMTTRRHFPGVHAMTCSSTASRSTSERSTCVRDNALTSPQSAPSVSRGGT